MGKRVRLLAGKRHDRESVKAVIACNAYLRMGPGRSLHKLHQSFTESSPEIEPPTTSFRWLKEWSRRYDWQERAETYDARKEEEKQRRAEEIMNSGLALVHERVEELKELAELLGKEISEEDKRWVPDVKQIGGGEYAERVDIVRFNAALIGEFRGTLDDLAKETGGRVKKSDVRHSWRDKIPPGQEDIAEELFRTVAQQLAEQMSDDADED